MGHKGLTLRQPSSPRKVPYLLHALQSLLEEFQLLVFGGVFRLALLLLEELHLVPIGVQLTTQAVVFFLQSFRLQL